MNYNKRFLDNININFIYNYFNNFDNIYLTGERQNGKSTLILLYLVLYLINNKDKFCIFICSGKTSFIYDKLYDVIKYLNLEYKGHIKYLDRIVFDSNSSLIIKKYDNFNNSLLRSKIDIIFIDNMEYIDIVGNISLFLLLRNIIKKYKTRIIANGQFNNKILNDITLLGFNDFKILKDDFIQNTRYFSLLYKINKIKERNE